MVLLDYIPETRPIGGVPFLEQDVPKQVPTWAARRAAAIRRRYATAVEEAMLAPDTWVPCPAVYTRGQRVLRAIGFTVKPHIPQQSVALDSKTGRLIFAQAEDLNDARVGRFHSKFGVVRPTAVC